MPFQHMDTSGGQGDKLPDRSVAIVPIVVCVWLSNALHNRF